MLFTEPSNRLGLDLCCKYNLSIDIVRRKQACSVFIVNFSSTCHLKDKDFTLNGRKTHIKYIEKASQNAKAGYFCFLLKLNLTKTTAKKTKRYILFIFVLHILIIKVCWKFYDILKLAISCSTAADKLIRHICTHYDFALWPNYPISLLLIFIIIEQMYMVIRVWIYIYDQNVLFFK